ncbi:hypothetical protein RRG08_036026 [Elysia crispata]|uniref:Uncharacterized protein n=1 Tax=Elysia crispata TaxID=231223 RepID=A0AAE1E1U5_9GAST|nr:hypothetical protein RRG08_036026 [Elysia crispata]
MVIEIRERELEPFPRYRSSPITLGGDQVLKLGTKNPPGGCLSSQTSLCRCSPALSSLFEPPLCHCHRLSPPPTCIFFSSLPFRSLSVLSTPRGTAVVNLSLNRSDLSFWAGSTPIVSVDVHSRFSFLQQMSGDT